MKKNYVVFSILLLAGFLITSGAQSIVSANSEGYTNEYKKETEYKTIEYKKIESKVSLSINQNGDVQFGGGKVVSVNGSTLNITVSGLPLSISTNSSTQIMGVSALSNMVAGDTVSGKGTINSSTGVITATIIKNESQNAQKITDLENQIKVLMEQLKKLQAESKLYR